MSTEKATENSGFLDGRDYTAAFVYEFCALLVGNGVYAGELAPTATNDNMTITHGSGHAWINGVCYKNTTPFVLDIATADGALNRYDSLMLRLDLSANETYAIIVQGEYATAPTPPACTRNAEIYDLKICDIYVPAGCTKITQDLITDTRMDASVCGVPVFPVDHLDLTTFYKQVAADLANFRAREQADFAAWVTGQEESHLATMHDLVELVRITSENSRAEILELLRQLNELVEGDTVGELITAINEKLPKTGGTMTGNLSMGDHRITDLAEPEDGWDAATKGYADTKASLPKTTSGTVIALSDASDGPLQGLRIYGRTTQDGTPTPDNPVELVSVGDGGSVGVTVAAKNLFDGNVNTTNDAKNVFLTRGTYTVSQSDKGTGNNWYIRAINTDDQIVTEQALSIENMLTNSDKSWYYGRSSYYWFRFKLLEDCYVKIGRLNATDTVPMQIEVGETATDYEPYTAQTLPISTPNGLPGIPVTSGGNYTDADGQQWICDEVDFARGVYVQRVAIKVFDGSESGWKLSEGSVNTIKWPVFSGGWSTCFAQSSHFQYGANNAYDNITGFFAVDAVGNSYFATGHTTLDDFKLWIAENPVTVVCRMATPIETHIPEDKLAAYAALHTNRPNTTVYNDAGAHMEVGYYPPDATMRQEDIMSALDHVGNAAMAYVDSKHFIATVSLPAASWVGDAAPYTQTVPVSGILATDFPHVTPVYSSTLATALAQKEAWSMVNQGVPGDGEITFACFEDKPATDIPIQIEVMR